MIRFDGHTATVSSLAFSPDSTLLASGAKDGSVKLWDAAGGLVREFAHGGISSGRFVAWSPAGDWLALTHHFTCEAIPADAAADPRHRRTLYLPETISAARFVDKHLIAIGTNGEKGSPGGSLVLWDKNTSNKRPVPHTINSSHGIRALTVDAATKHLHWLVGVANSSACVWRSWDITKPNATDLSLGKPAQALAVSDDGKMVAVATDWTVRLYPVGGDSFAELKGHKGRVSAAAFIRGGRAVSTAGWDGTVRFWDVTTAKETARFPAEAGTLTALAASPDGTRVAVGGSDGGIVVIDVE